MSVCLVPGSFDPITFGHMDVIERAIALFDTVVVAILRNPEKTGWLSWDEREALIRECIAGRPFERAVRVIQFEGLLIDCAKANRANAIARGLRAAADFEYEVSWARINRAMAAVETVFFASSPEYAHISAAAARQLAAAGGSIELFVPRPAIALLERMGKAGTGRVRGGGRSPATIDTCGG
ncbi:MAG: pantetheine-phosphate adenylyltransferase [Oscillospiraceae bacterium]|nr:pantetheine-phosphate adenylyltransferase [Oscillospiraceae bacterium]